MRGSESIRMSDTEDPPWELIDCFAGGGLASFGFRAAGMCVVSAVDICAEALGVYKSNFQNNISCATLGPGLSEHTFPEPRPRLHLHLSPPCQELSNAKSGARSDYGIMMLRWSIETGSRYESFSVETVHTGQTLALAKQMATARPGKVAYGVYDAVNFSCAQNRMRLIVATPDIIKQLNEAPAASRVSIEDAFRSNGVPIPAGATHVKNSSAVVDGTNVRPIKGPAFTCCASRALSFCTADGTTVLSMRPEHTRVLMGLPTSYTLSGKQRIDQRVLGNGVVFGLARAIALAAMGKTISPLTPPPTSHPAGMHSSKSRKRAAEPENASGQECMCCHELADRFQRLERRISRMHKLLRRNADERIQGSQ